MIYLLIDTQNFHYRSIFTYNHDYDENSKLFDGPEKFGYKDKFFMDLNYLANRFTGFPITNLVFLDEYKSWRKQINADYKAQRKSNEKINWEVFNKELKPEITKILIDKGYLYHQNIDLQLESDDLIYFWNKTLNRKNINSIIISSDADLNQLVYRNKNSWSIRINLQAKNIYISEGSRKKDEPILFDTKEDVFDYFLGKKLEEVDHYNNLINKFSEEGFKIVEIKPERELLKKIIQGDKGDNIKAVYFSGKRGIGEKGAQKIVDSLPEFSIKHLKSEDFLNYLAVQCAPKTKRKIIELIKEIKDNIIKNTELVYLDEEIFIKNLGEKIKDIPGEIEEYIVQKNK